MKSEHEERIDELVETTKLTKREAQVYVLYHEAPDEEYATHEDVAAEIGIAPGNCRSKLSSVRRKNEKAREQVELVENTATLFI